MRVTRPRARVRPFPHQHVGEPHIRRVQGLTAHVQIMLGEHRAVMRPDRADDRFVGQVGLDDDAARVLTATGATGDLFEQVERALASARKSGILRA